MAKKNDNILLWVAALGIGGYLYYKYTQGQVPALPGSSTVPNANTGVLALLPSPNTVNNLPSANPNPGNAPVNTPINTTNLIAVQVDPNTNAPILKPGQSLAVDNGGMPIVNANGQPMIFAPTVNNNDSLQKMFANNDYPGGMMAGEIL
jgi:hypothetical protein